MDQQAALKASAFVIGIALVCLLAWLSFDGHRWAQVALAVLFVGGIWGGFYWAFKDD